MLIFQAAKQGNSKMQVQQTQDYNLFKRLPGNRQINKNHLRHLQESLERENLSPSQPILVNENFEVIDGQHRLEALKALGEPIYYVQAQGLGLGEVQTLNTLAKNWTPIDYAKSYIELGKPAYQIYLELRSRYRVPHNLLLNYAYFNTNHRSNRDFKQGKLEFVDVEATKRCLDQLQEIGVYYPGYTRAIFGQALLMLLRHPDYNHERMVAKFKSRAHTVKNLGTIEDNQRQLEAIYNYHAQDRVRFF